MKSIVSREMLSVILKPRQPFVESKEEYCSYGSKINSKIMFLFWPDAIATVTKERNCSLHTAL